METQQDSENVPDRSTVIRLPTKRDGFLAYEIRMPVSATDFRKMAAQLDEAYAEHDHIDLLVRIVGGLRFNLDLLSASLLKVKRDAIKHVDNYAVVGGPDWLEKAVELLNPLFRMDVRHFDGDDEDEAWQWLRSVRSAA